MKKHICTFNLTGENNMIIEKEVTTVNLVKKISKMGKEYFIVSGSDNELGVLEEFCPVELVPNVKSMTKQVWKYEVYKINNKLSLKLVCIE